MKTSKDQPLGTIHDIPLDDIQISEDNVRHQDPTKDLEELAASIKRHGLLQPVVLNGEYGQAPYELISGQRRFLAHQQILKWPKIRAVFAGKLTQPEAVVRSGAAPARHRRRLHPAVHREQVQPRASGLARIPDPERCLQQGHGLVRLLRGELT